MTNQILSLEQCKRNLESIQDILNEKCSQEPNQLMNRLNDLSALLGTSAQLVASYQYHVDSASLNAIKFAKTEGYAPSMAKTYVEGLCADIRAEYRMAERQCSALVHALDAVRSILSFTKQELFAANSQRG